MSAGPNGNRMYLGKKGIICSVEVFLMGVASDRSLKGSAHVIVKWMVPTDRGSGPMKSTCPLIEPKHGRTACSVWFGSIIAIQNKQNALSCVQVTVAAALP